jgi:hypothetical protein
VLCLSWAIFIRRKIMTGRCAGAGAQTNPRESECVQGWAQDEQIGISRERTREEIPTH